MNLTSFWDYHDLKDMFQSHGPTWYLPEGSRSSDSQK
jgi:hypothetical protein